MAEYGRLAKTQGWTGVSPRCAALEDSRESDEYVPYRGANHLLVLSGRQSAMSRYAGREIAKRSIARQSHA